MKQKTSTEHLHQGLQVESPVLAITVRMATDEKAAWKRGPGPEFRPVVDGTALSHSPGRDADITGEGAAGNQGRHSRGGRDWQGGRLGVEAMRLGVTGRKRVLQSHQGVEAQSVLPALPTAPSQASDHTRAQQMLGE